MREQGLGLLQALADLDGIGKHDFTSLLLILLISAAMPCGVRSVMGSFILIPAFLVALITAYVDGLRMVKAWV
ncbi:MAG: hypothetical protein VR66_11435 [Peptococcaceae bacterium BRH_c23]|nr:MAG: hypothetical protein VR66_11435 [Peptococcaceae bacterium BRH_c23]